jgi:hypothetical protein
MIISNLTNSLPKYSTPWIAFAYFTLTVGYSKIPLISIPIGIIIIAIDWNNLMRILRTKVGISHMFFCGLFLFYFLARLALRSESFDLTTLNFILALFYKAFIGLYIAYIFAYLIINKSSLIYLYLLLQIFLIVLSAFNINVYSFLLIFQTADANDVFGEIFGKRSTGFGVIHNEGIVFLILIYTIYTSFVKELKFYHFMLGIIMYLTAFSSRLILVLLPVWQIIKSVRSLMAIGLIVLLYILNFDVDDGPLSHVFELWNYYLINGTLGTTSTDVIARMVYMPSEIGTWIIGDGKFFDDTGFYKSTDIGFSRIIFFGGIIGFIFYVMVFFWPLFFMYSKFYKVNFYLVIFIIYVYVLSNIKGINMQTFPFLFIVIYHNYIKEISKVYEHKPLTCTA